jgi:hypothetical protein
VDVWIGEETDGPTIAATKDAPPSQPHKTWMIESERSTSVTRWSGTMSHVGKNPDLLSQTIYALVHHAFGMSHRKLVFADMQGKIFS